MSLRPRLPSLDFSTRPCIFDDTPTNPIWFGATNVEPIRVGFDSYSYVQVRDAPRVKGPAKCKIMCTIGAKSSSREMIERLFNSGMHVMRLNMAMGFHHDRAQTISHLRKYLSEVRKQCAILIDLRGAGLRVCSTEHDKDVELQAGQEFCLFTDQSVCGNRSGIAVDFSDFPALLSPGDEVLIDYGKVELMVARVEAEEGRVVCIVKHSTSLRPNKPIFFKGKSPLFTIPSQQDVLDIRFALDQQVDFIAISHVRTARDIHAVRELLGIRGQGIKLVAKIQTNLAVENFDDILEAADAVMLVRGDLGVELPVEQVCIAQKVITRKCNAAGKPCILATQMLESMMRNLRPTRAEATDVVNAVLEGADCLMLSGETARGEYPVQAVETMLQICKEAESLIDYRADYALIQSANKEPLAIREAIASSAVKAVFDLRADLIICMSATGSTARLVAKYKPNTPILCITSNEQTAHQTLLSRGIFPILVGSLLGTDSLVTRAIQYAKANGMVQKGSLVVVTAGMREGVAGATNVLKILTVD